MDVKRLGLVLLVCLAGCGSGSPIPPVVNAKTLPLDRGVTPRDQKWIQAAIAQARPEALQLIDDVDGMVVIKTASAANVNWVGLTELKAPGRYTVTFNVAYLDGERKLDRNATVLHELGHVIDNAVVPPELRDQ